MTENQGARTRRKRFVGLLVMGVVLLAAGGWWLIGRDGGASGGAADSSRTAAQATEPPPVDADRAAVLAAGLTAGDETQLRSVVAVPADQPLEDGVLEQLALSAPVVLDPATFTSNGDGTATISATVGADAQPWRVVLLAVDGQWMVAQTLPG